MKKRIQKIEKKQIIAKLINEYKKTKPSVTEIINLIQTKDAYTTRHCMGVYMITNTICDLLELSTLEKDVILKAALLHDIGKVYIPDTILFKTSTLSEDEYQIMKSHAQKGAEILEILKMDPEIIKIVKHHHEKYDGTGYPDGLIGEKIPFGSRIISIADSIDAMLGDRVYRKKLSYEICHQEIERNLGIMYTPDIGGLVSLNWEVCISQIK